MPLSYVFLVAVYYIYVQCALMYNLSGQWRTVAFLPIPVISLTMCLSVVPGILDPITSTLLTMFAVPIATIYLLVVAMAWVLCVRSGVWRPRHSPSTI